MGRFVQVSNGELKLPVPSFLSGRKSVSIVERIMTRFDTARKKLGQATMRC